MLTNEEVGRRIRQARQGLGLSQTELGQKLTRPRTHAAISDIERGKTKLDVEELSEFARLLGKTLADFVEAQPPAVLYRRSTATVSPQDRREKDRVIEAFKERARALARQRAEGEGR